VTKHEHIWIKEQQTGHVVCGWCNTCDGYCKDWRKMKFINEFYYESLGPANDEIAEMAEEAWETQQSKEVKNGRLRG
jgi:hypothetical protein